MPNITARPHCGIEVKPEASPVDTAIRGSIVWPAHKHLDDLEKQVASGVFSPLTLKKRRSLLKTLRENYGEYAIDMPQDKVIALRDKFFQTPAKADLLVGAVKSLYLWACERDLCDVNPATGIVKIDRGKSGAAPWTV